MLCRRLRVLVVSAVGPGQLETMTARVPDAGQADPLSDVGQITPADRIATGHRALSDVSASAAPSASRAESGFFDDLGERAVEVEEHRGLPFGRQAQGLQSVGQLGHPPVAGTDHDVAQVR